MRNAFGGHMSQDQGGWGQPQQPGPPAGQWGPPPGQGQPQWVQPPPPKKKRGGCLTALIGVGAFVVVLVVIIAVANAGKKTAAKVDTPAAGSSQPATSAPAKAKKSATASFGEAYRWSDGLQASVSGVRSYTPSQYAAGTKPGDAAIIITVKIKNGTQKPFDPSLFTVNVKAGADGVQAEQIFDNSSGLGFTGTILPGSSATQKFAYDIPKGATGTLDVEVEPDATLQYDSEHWVGKTP
jgi:hypothetical protein